jgi:hypothetical protein
MPRYNTNTCSLWPDLFGSEELVTAPIGGYVALVHKLISSYSSTVPTSVELVPNAPARHPDRLNWLHRDRIRRLSVRPSCHNLECGIVAVGGWQCQATCGSTQPRCGFRRIRPLHDLRPLGCSVDGHRHLLPLSASAGPIAPERPKIAARRRERRDAHPLQSPSGVVLDCVSVGVSTRRPTRQRMVPNTNGPVRSEFSACRNRPERRRAALQGTESARSARDAVA